tara:strand:- start:290 stop:700 length:411 start_codon:yes stop_codon:yes gene_type:complete
MITRIIFGLFLLALFISLYIFLGGPPFNRVPVGQITDLSLMWLALAAVIGLVGVIYFIFTKDVSFNERWRFFRVFTILIGLFLTMLIIVDGFGWGPRGVILLYVESYISLGDGMIAIILSWMPYFFVSTIEMFFKK